jgi:hypothetical protein
VTLTSEGSLTVQLDQAQPMPNTTLEFVLDGEMIECDVYKISCITAPCPTDVTTFLPEIISRGITYKIVARRRR